MIEISHIKPTIVKPCPECGKPLVIRVNRVTGKEFLGCPSWPECVYSEPLPEDIKMRAENAPALPGFE